MYDVIGAGTRRWRGAIAAENYGGNGAIAERVLDAVTGEKRGSVEGLRAEAPSGSSPLVGIASAPNGSDTAM